MFRLKKTKFNKPLPFVKLIPNFLTILALCIGISSIRFALESKWEYSVTCIVIAAILDSLDGRIARMLGATSHFGAELDSLCDFVNFGVVPSLLMYFWSFQGSDLRDLSWVSLLLFVVCVSIRLARFNTALLDSDPKSLSKRFFIGVPSTLGGLLLIVPIITEFNIARLLNIEVNNSSNTLYLIIYQTIIALLMTSRIPTYSLKNLIIKPEYIWICMFLGGAMIISIIMYPWYVIPILATIYIATIPFSIISARKIN